MSEQRFEEHIDQRRRDMEVIELDVDQNGFPVMLEVGSWFVCFVPGLKKQWWHPSYLLGRPYWVWTPHGLYKLLLREPNVCRVDVSALLRLDAAKLAKGSRVIVPCDECQPGATGRCVGAAKPFRMKCGRDL